MAANHIRAKFSLTLLHPRYWLTWCGLFLLYLLVLLPYPLLHKLGHWFGRQAIPFMKRRVNITRRNLELCFPTMSVTQRDALLVKNFASTGMGIIETGMAWFWPDWRIRRWFTVEGLENMHDAQQGNRGVLVIGLHFLTLELGARIFGMQNAGIGVYRPNDNKLLEWLQTKGRLRSNKYMLDRRDVRGMARSLKQGEILWYAPDHDYGPHNSIFAPFFNVPQTATTLGLFTLARVAKPAIVPFALIRRKNATGYTLLIQPALENIPLDNDLAAATYMNKVIEKEILRAPEQYMWLHRRFKTRPPGSPGLY